jgi:hypothetical protein
MLHATIFWLHATCVVAKDSFFYWCNNLVEKLTLLLKYECINPLKPQLKIKKIVTIVLYGFTNGFSPKHIYV